MAQDNKGKFKFNTGLLYALDFDEKSKETIRNFAQDFQIPSVPPDDIMNIPVAVVTEINEEKDPSEVLEFFSGPVKIRNFNVVMENIEGKNVLLVEYDSPVLEKIFDSIQKSYSKLDQEEKEFDFILSSDAPSDIDLDHLSFKFNQYMQFLVGSEDISGFYSLEMIDRMMIGVQEESGDK